MITRITNTLTRLIAHTARKCISFPAVTTSVLLVAYTVITLYSCKTTMISLVTANSDLIHSVQKMLTITVLTSMKYWTDFGFFTLTGSLFLLRLTALQYADNLRSLWIVYDT